MTLPSCQIERHFSLTCQEDRPRVHTSVVKRKKRKKITGMLVTHFPKETGEKPREVSQFSQIC